MGSNSRYNRSDKRLDEKWFKQAVESAEKKENGGGYKKVSFNTEKDGFDKKEHRRKQKKGMMSNAFYYLLFTGCLVVLTGTGTEFLAAMVYSTFTVILFYAVDLFYTWQGK